MESVEFAVNPVKNFFKDSMMLLRRCNKPDARGDPSTIDDGQHSCAIME